MATVTTLGSNLTDQVGAVAINLPSHASGDLLWVAVVKTGASSSSPGISTGGWTLAVDDPNASSNTHNVWAWILGDGSMSSVTVTSMGGVNRMLTGKVTGAGGSPSISTSLGTITSTTSATIGPAGSPASGGTQIVLGCIDGAFTSPALSNSYTLDVQNLNSGVIGHKDLTGSDTSTSFTWSTSRSGRSAAIYIAPAATSDARRGMDFRSKGF